MLHAQGLRKRYRAREVVRDFSFRLDPGEVVGLLGPNGAGKTTCFYLVVGLVAASSNIGREKSAAMMAAGRGVPSAKVRATSPVPQARSRRISSGRTPASRTISRRQ